MVYNQNLQAIQKRIVIFTAALLPSFPLFSQQIIQDTATLQTVVIQSTRAEDNNPVPHSNFSEKEIRKSYQAQDVPMLLSSVPSLVENSDAGAGVGYTGLRIRGSDPTQVNVTINGVPLNDAESQGMYWVDLPDLAASAAEIQVQRGVGTSSNGAGAFGATVNVDLSKVESTPFAVVSNTFGSFATRKHSAYLGTGLIGGKLAFTGRISTIQSDGYIDRASSDLNSFHLTGTYIDDKQSFQAHVLSGHERTYQAWYGLPAQYLDTLRTFNPAGTEKADAPYQDEVDDYTQRHFLAFYKYNLNRNWSLQLNGHYTRGFGYYEQYKAGESAGDYGLLDWAAPGESAIQETNLVRRRWLDNHFYGVTFALKQVFQSNRNSGMLLGGGVSQYDGRHYGELIWTQSAPGVPKDFVYYDNDATKRDANIFLKWDNHVNDHLSTFADLQLRRVDYQFLGFNNNLDNVTQNAGLTFFNPKIGATYSFSNKWTMTGFAGIGNREPNRDDYTQSTPNSRPKSESMLDLEASLRTKQHSWTASANFYFMDYHNQLVLDGRLNDVGAYIRTNVPRSYRAGVELQTAVQIGSRLEVNGNASFSRNKVQTFVEYRDNWDSGEQERIEYSNTNLAFSPNFTSRVEATVLILSKDKQDLSVSLSGKHVAKQYLDNTSNENTILPSYFFSDLRLNYDLEQVIGKKVSLIFTINNLFNKQYVSNGWTYRYTSAGYDPRGDDPYSRSEGNGVYHQAGFFPQAGRYWMGTVVVRM